MAWLEAWGTYAKSGPYNNVTMGGSPNGSMYGLNLTSAKNAGFGNGVQFTSLNDTGTSVKIELSLVGYGSNTSGQAILNQKYVQGNWTYDWYVDVYYSTDNQASWATVEKNILVAKHASTQGLAYRTNWHLSTIKWSKTFTLPNNFTHLKFEVRGDTPAQRHQNIFSRQIVLPDMTTRWIGDDGTELATQEVSKSFKEYRSFEGWELSRESIDGTIKTYIYTRATFKPWAIRKSGVWKSLDNPTGHFSIRSKGQWIDKSEDSLADVGKVSKGHNRIRKNNQFKQQGKLGR